MAIFVDVMKERWDLLIDQDPIEATLMDMDANLEGMQMGISGEACNEACGVVYPTLEPVQWGSNSTAPAPSP